MVGTAYADTLFYNTSTSHYENQVWIDFNDYGTFAASEAVTQVFGTGVCTTNVTQDTSTIRIPAGATTGTHRMRIRNAYANTCPISTAMNPCGQTDATRAYYFGATNDYLATIIPSNCSGTPSAGTAAATVSSGCMPYTSVIAVTGATTLTGSSYQWYQSADSISYTAISGATGTAYSYTNNTGTVYIKCVTTCSVSSLTATSNVIRINGTASPAVTVTASSDTICSGASTSLSATGAVTYSWTPSATLSATTGATVTATPTVTTVYTVTGTNGSGCTTAITKTIRVNVGSSITIAAGSPTICSGNNTTLTAAGGSSYSWSPATGLSSTTGTTVTAAPVATTTYTLSGLSSGCPATATRTITVNAIPVVTVTPVSATICSGNNTNITAAGAFSYIWTPSTGLNTSTRATVNASPTVTTTYSITAYSTSGCRSSATQTINVSSLPVVSVTPVSASICIGSSTNITSTGATSYSWAPGASLSATTGATVTATPTVTTTYTITGISVSSGCSNTLLQTITVGTGGGVSITSGPTTICSGNSTSLSATGGSAYSWSPSAGLSATTGTSVTATPTTTTTYTLSATSGGCPATATKTITVNPVPVLTVTAVSPTICSGNNTNITAAGAFSYVWTPSTGLNTTTRATVSAGPSSTTTYSITGYTSYGCSVTSTIVLSVNPTPSVSLSAGATTICLGNSTGLSASGAVTYAWSPSATLSASTGASVLATPTSSVTYSVTGYSAAGCSATRSQFINVGTPATATVVSASSPCEETSSNITINGTTGDTLFYTLDGGAYQTATFVAGTLNLATGIITAPHTYFIHDVHHTGCIITIDSNIVMAPLPVTWNGGTSNNWATAANWNCGAVPLATQGVLIPAGTTYEPIIGIGDSGLARYLTIMPGSNLTVSNTGRLSVKNKLLNNGNVKGSGTVTLNGSSSQHIAGYGKVANLELNNAAGATMDTASKLTITNSLKLTAGTFTTNDSVVLYSDSSTTARVKPITSGSISGNVYVQQFIQGGRRAYRFWSHPFSSYTSLAQAGLAIDVTGAGGAANGFTSTASNAPSAYRYNPLVGNDSLGYDPGWRPFTSALPTADSNRIHQYQGIRLYIRGVKGSGLGYAPYVPAAVTITQWGPLNQGNQRVVLQKGSLNHQGINMLGNPYAAPVDLGTVLYRAKASGNITGSGFWVWNPNLGAAGQYQTIAIGTSTPVPYNLQANTAFQVSAAHNGDTINFTENDKADSVSAYLFRQAQNGITLGVYDANYHPWDYTYIQFDSKAADRFDTSLDAVKLSAADFGFSSISADGQNLSIDARPFSNNYTIPLAVTSGYMQDMIIRADDMTLPDSAIVYLHDKLLGQYIRMQKATEYRFSITKDTATQGRNRFELAMKKASDTFAVSLAKVNMWLAPNPATDDITISYVMPEQSATKLRVLDMAGICVLERNLGIDKTGTVKVPVQKLAAGIYLVELTSGNNTVIKRFVKE